MSFFDFTTDEGILSKRFENIEKNVKSKPNEVNAKLEANYKEINAEERSLVIEFPVLQWEVNYAGILHGGLICTMLDHVSGMTATCFLDKWTPTVSMDTHFLRKAEVGDTLIGKGWLDFFGNRAIQLHAQLVSAKTGKVVATSSSTHVPI